MTGQDVADRAGVSRATVSYVLNDAAGQPISAETRARVLAAAAELGYTPHAAARQLRTGVSDLILLALPPWPLSHALTLCVSAFTQRLGELGYTALVDPATEEVAHLEHTLARVQPIALVASAEHLSAPLVARLRVGRHPSGARLRRSAAGLRPRGRVRPVARSPGSPWPTSPSRGHRSVLAVMPDGPGVPVVPGRPRRRASEEAAAEHGMALTVVESPLDHERVAEVVADLARRPRPTRTRCWPTTTTTPSSPCGPSSTPASGCPTTSP